MSWGPGKSKFWTCSTGPKPSQLVPKFIKCALETQNHRIEPNKPIIIFNAASIQHFQLVPNPFNSSKTQSTGPQIERAEAQASAADKENNDPGAEARASDADKENNEVGAEFTPKRVRRDFQLQRLLAMPNKEMFADPNIESFMQSRTVRERLEKYGQEVCSQMSSEELLSSGDSLRHVKETKAYKEWTQKVPTLTRSCLTFLKENQSGVKKEDRSELFVMDSLAETLRALRMNPTKEGREQELVIAASLCSTETMTMTMFTCASMIVTLL